MRPYVLFYLYRTRLRVHAIQELLAGVGVAVAVALVFATLVSNDSVTSAAGEVVHAAIGPATLQLAARNVDGVSEQPLLKRVNTLPGVKQAAPELEQSATVYAADGRQATVNLTGTTISLAIVNGLIGTAPVSALSEGIGLSSATAKALGVQARGRSGAPSDVSLSVRGLRSTLQVTSVLDAAT